MCVMKPCRQTVRPHAHCGNERRPLKDEDLRCRDGDHHGRGHVPRRTDDEQHANYRLNDGGRDTPSGADTDCCQARDFAWVEQLGGREIEKEQSQHALDDSDGGFVEHA